MSRRRLQFHSPATSVLVFGVVLALVGETLSAILTQARNERAIFFPSEVILRPDKDKDTDTSHSRAFACEDTSGRPGTCVEVNECPSIRETMHLNRPKICAWSGSESGKPFICCPNEIAGTDILAPPPVGRPDVTPGDGNRNEIRPEVAAPPPVTLNAERRPTSGEGEFNRLAPEVPTSPPAPVDTKSPSMVSSTAAPASVIAPEIKSSSVQQQSHQEEVKPKFQPEAETISASVPALLAPPPHHAPIAGEDLEKLIAQSLGFDSVSDISVTTTTNTPTPNTPPNQSKAPPTFHADIISAFANTPPSTAPPAQHEDLLMSILSITTPPKPAPSPDEIAPAPPVDSKGLQHVDLGQLAQIHNGHP